MAPALALEALLGLHLADALAALAAAGEPEPTVARTAPTQSAPKGARGPGTLAGSFARTRHALPETVDWRVARARRAGASIALVAVAALPLPEPTP